MERKDMAGHVAGRRLFHFSYSIPRKPFRRYLVTAWEVVAVMGSFDFVPLRLTSLRMTGIRALLGRKGVA
jgi:hypothetical protein